MRITSKGQVTIPIAVRERLGLLPDTEVEFVVRDGYAELRKRRRGSGRGPAIVARLRGRGTVKLTTEQILAMTRGG